MLHLRFFYLNNGINCFQQECFSQEMYEKSVLLKKNTDERTRMNKRIIQFALLFIRGQYSPK